MNHETFMMNKTQRPNEWSEDLGQLNKKWHNTGWNPSPASKKLMTNSLPRLSLMRKETFNYVNPVDL